MNIHEREERRTLRQCLLADEALRFRRQADRNHFVNQWERRFHQAKGTIQ